VLPLFQNTNNTTKLFNMKLNQPQIQDLYAFTKQHYVDYYDLQTELVDHLANDIEAIWEVQPKLSFEEAKSKAFKKFGVFGFMDALEQKQKAMSKRYRSYLWTEFKTWCAMPKIVISMTLFLSIYTLFTTTFAKQFSIGLYVIICLWSCYKCWQLNKMFKIRNEKYNKKWMLEDIIFNKAGIMVLVLLSQVHTFFTMLENAFNNVYKIASLATAFTLLILINYIILELLPNKAEKLLINNYPEFSL